MEVHNDFRELLACFNARGVEYLVVGSFALAFHGAPRYTGDIDLLVKPDLENSRRILGALADFGFTSLGLAEDEFIEPDQVLQLGVPPVRVDIMTSIGGVSWDEAWAGRAPGDCGGVPVHYLGREQFIANKRAAGRAKDIADLETLGEAG
jgi:hypothetical protein